MILIATRLGIIACSYLANGYYEHRYISAPEIAERYNMNVRALMPALRQLTRVGILRSRVGGSTPGFIFSKDPAEFTLLQILNALEGSTDFPCCKELVPNLKCHCEDETKCKVISLFNGAIDNAATSIGAVSVAEYAKSANY